VCGVWQKLFPYLKDDFISFDLPLVMGKLKIQCVTLAKQAGFNEVEEKDADELWECHDNYDTSTDELKQLHKEPGLVKTVSDDKRDNNDEEKPLCKLTKNILQNSLAKIECLQELDNNNCNTKRSEEVLRMVKQDLACYYQLLHEKSKARKQLKVFFKEAMGSRSIKYF
jgi:hypothetical protein